MTLLGVSLQPHDLEVIVPNNWVPPDTQPQVQAEPALLTLFTFHFCLIPTGPWMSSRLGLYVSFRSVLQGSGLHAVHGLPGPCLWHSLEDLVFMLIEIQYLVWQTRARPRSPRHTQSQYLPCAQSLDTCINLEHEHLEVSLTLDFKQPAMVITTQFQGASFGGSWFPSKHALAFVQSYSTWPLL